MQKQEYWDFIICPKRHLFDINFTELWEYRDLLLMFIKRDIVTVYKQTILGPIWFFIQPIMTTLIYVVVFGNIAGISTDGIPKQLFYLSGILIWNYFAQCFNQSSNTFRQNAALFEKVYFPRLIIPLSKALSSLIKFGIQALLFVAVYGFVVLRNADVRPTSWLLLTPCFVLLMAAMGLAFGMIFSSLTSKYRDLIFLIQFGVQLLMYASPVIYPLSTLKGSIRDVMLLNPIAYVLEGFRYALLGAGVHRLSGLVYATVFTVFILAFGIVIFHKAEHTFMDTV
ncbi:ABC transporter permease [candidate division KSB3 bacterium]|uniref:Transport permease protein n=1 Tax=candidate division KSB3 bacterium TaxID=2044937 RepID=A0A2G6EDZ2_9BACT|nr:MAG: ABC transporter permease [candidate division KSB3 bacterium]